MTTEITNAITATQVADYLASHPDFFLKHEQLLADIFLPHASGSAISLLERQVKILRERNIDTRKRLADMLEQGQRNDILFNKTRSLILDLLESKSLNDLSRRITQYCEQEFQVDKAVFSVFATPELHAGSLCRVIAPVDASRNMPSLLASTECISGSFRPDELRFLFGEADNIASAIVMPVRIETKTAGMLALGSEDPHYFKAGMDTLFLRFIGDVIVRLLPRFC